MTHTYEQSRKGAVLAALSGLFYGLLGWFGITLINSGSSVVNMLFWRFSLASLMLFLMFRFYYKLPLLKELKKLSAATLLNFLISILFSSASTVTYFLAAQRVGTGLGMALFFCFPAMVVLLAWLADKKRPTMATFISLIGILIGCSFISSGEEGYFDLYGILFALVSALTYALFIFWNKRTLLRVNSTLATGIVCAGNGFILGLLTFAMSSFSFFVDGSMWVTLIGLSLIATALPMLFLLEGMKYISASLAAIFSVFEPLVTLFIGITVLSEPATAIQLCGAGIILASAILAQKKEKMPTEI